MSKAQAQLAYPPSLAHPNPFIQQDESFGILVCTSRMMTSIPLLPPPLPMLCLPTAGQRKNDSWGKDSEEKTGKVVEMWGDFGG